MTRRETDILADDMAAELRKHTYTGGWSIRKTNIGGTQQWGIVVRRDDTLKAYADRQTWEDERLAAHDATRQAN